MNVAVQAGYSAENAVRASVKDLGRLYEKGSDILDEFRYIESQLRLSVPVKSCSWIWENAAEWKILKISQQYFIQQKEQAGI